jgi:hypothetical protein
MGCELARPLQNVTSKMKTTLAKSVAGVIVALTLLCGASKTWACNSGSDPGWKEGIFLALGGMAAAGAIDLSFSIHDGVVAVQGEHSSTGASVAEIVLTLPQVGLGAYVASKATQPGDRLAVLALTAWPALLAVHGFYSLATTPADAGEQAQRKRPPDQASVSFAPSAVSDGVNLAPGLMALGRF